MAPVWGALAAVATVFVVAAVFLSAYHAPAPHQLPIGISGPSQVVDPIAQGLSQAGDTFDVRTYSEDSALRDAIASREVYGGLALTGPASADIITTSANGAATVGTIQGTFARGAAEANVTTTDVDLAPLPSGDNAGLSVFFLVFAMALGSVAAGIPFLAFRTRLIDGLVASLAIGVLGGLVSAVTAVTWFGAAPGTFIGVWAVGALTLFAMSAFVLACVRLLGVAGLGVGATLIAVIGTAASGGAVNSHFYPAVWRAVGPLLPNDAGVSLITGAAYFEGAGISRDITVLVVWSIGSILLLALGERLRGDRHEQENPASSAPKESVSAGAS